MRAGCHVTPYVPTHRVAGPGRTWRTASALAVSAVLYLGGLGCSERRGSVAVTGDGWWRSDTPDVVPQILNEDLPFRYPAALFMQRVEGNVMLRLFVDASGNVVTDSSRVVEASGYAALDSAALAGASRLQFRAARRRGVPIAVSLLFPVHFRHPDRKSTARDSL